MYRELLSVIKAKHLYKQSTPKTVWNMVVTYFKQTVFGVYFDRVMACNLRFKMCYFTDASYTNNLKGVFKASEIPVWSKALLTRALKLQIGCGTEPTLYP